MFVFVSEDCYSNSRNLLYIFQNLSNEKKPIILTIYLEYSFYKKFVPLLKSGTIWIYRFPARLLSTPKPAKAL